jgi:hypothetical protein
MTRKLRYRSMRARDTIFLRLFLVGRNYPSYEKTQSVWLVEGAGELHVMFGTLDSCAQLVSDRSTP